MSEWRSDFLAISSTSLFLDLAKVSCLTLIWMKKIDIVKGDLEEFLEKNLPNLLQLYQLREPFHHYLQLPFKLKINIRPTIILYCYTETAQSGWYIDQNCW